jgi:hypothetical protein
VPLELVTVHREKLIAPPSRRSGGMTDAFEEAGFELRQIADGDALPKRSTILLIGSARWYPKTFQMAAQMPDALRPYVVMWQVEPVPLPSDSGFPRQSLHAREIAKIVLRDKRITDPGSNARRLLALLRSGQPDLLVVSSSTKQAYFVEKGYRPEVVPLGYYPAEGEDLGLERDIDVTFIGALDVPRRKQILRGLKRAGVSVHAVGRWGDPRYWGAERTGLLNRTKILLNLARFPGQHSGPRLLLGMANKTLVISEPMFRNDPFVAGEHFVSMPIAEMPETIERYLNDAAERERIAQQGHEFVTNELTMTRSLVRIRELIEAGRDA